MTRDEFDRSILVNCAEVARQLGLPCITSSEAEALWRRYVAGRNTGLFDAVARGDADPSRTAVNLPLDRHI
jgi:hypothetical protein